jgi:hypothetical protein
MAFKVVILKRAKIEIDEAVFTMKILKKNWVKNL